MTTSSDDESAVDLLHNVHTINADLSSSSAVVALTDDDVDVPPALVVNRTAASHTHWRSHRYFIVTVATIAIFIDSLFYTLIVPLLATYQQLFDLTQVQLGALVAVFALVQIFVAPVAGFVAERRGPRIVLLVGLSSMTLATLLFAFANSYWLMLLARALQGVSGSISWTAALAMIGRLPINGQGRAFSIVMTAAGVGGLIGPPLSGAITAASGDRRLPFLAVIGLIVIDLVSRFLLREPPRVGPQAPSLSMKESYKRLLFDAGFVVMLLVTILASFINIALEPILSTMLFDRWQFDTFKTGLVFASMSIPFLICSPIVGWLCDRFPRRRRDLVSAGALVAGLTFLPLPYIDLIGLFVVVLAVMGGAISFVSTPTLPAINEMVIRKHGESLTSAAGALQNLVWSLSSSFGPMIVSGIAQGISFEAALLSVGCITIVSAAIFTFFSRSPQWSVRLFGNDADAGDNKDNKADGAGDDAQLDVPAARL